MPSNLTYPTPPPLPARADLLAMPSRTLSLIDQAEIVLLALYGVDQNFTRLLDGVYPPACVEGAVADDETLAALIVREYALNHELPQLGDCTTHQITLALRRAMSRKGIGRRQRRELANGHSAEPTE